MKKAIIIAALLIILSVVYIGTQFYAPINQVALILKHISIFLIVGIIAFVVITFLAKRIIKRFIQTDRGITIVNSIKTAVFILLVALVSFIQFDYVAYAESPHIKYCSYYDHYNNLIYESVFHSVCPEVIFEKETSNVFSFTIKEESDAYQVASLMDETVEISDQNSFHIDMETVITIEYRNTSSIKQIDQQTTYVASYIEYGSKKVMYNSYSKNIFYFDGDVFSSRVRTAETNEVLEGYTTYPLTHHSFEESDYSETLYYFEQYDTEESSSMLATRYDFYKEDNESTEVIAKVDLFEMNDTLGYYVEEIDSNISRSSYNTFDIPEDVNFKYMTSFTNRNNDTGVISNNYYSITAPHYINHSTYTSDVSVENVYYDSLIQDGKLYLTPKSEGVTTEYEYNFYEITEMDYGYQVAHYNYPIMPYVWYTLTGLDSQLDKSYYEDGRYFYGLQYQIQFDVEYEIYQISKRTALFTNISFIQY